LRGGRVSGFLRPLKRASYADLLSLSPRLTPGATVFCRYAGFVVSHPFHGEAVERMGHPQFNGGSRVGHPALTVCCWAETISSAHPDQRVYTPTPKSRTDLLSPDGSLD